MGEVAGVCASAGVMRSAKHAPEMIRFFILFLVTF